MKSHESGERSCLQESGGIGYTSVAEQRDEKGLHEDASYQLKTREGLSVPYLLGGLLGRMPVGTSCI
eukprot:3485402-Pyramimonas_sp.AAC.1